jgi:manganese/zinc/iron transport system substrate-binding protein
MLADLARNLVTQGVEVTALMPPGTDPHLYKPTQNDLARLRQADLILFNGLHLEGKMIDALEKLAREKKVVAVGDSLPHGRLRPTQAGEFDPHLWFDPQIWSEAAQVAAISLFQITGDSSVFERAKTYQAELGKLDAEIRASLAGLETRVLVTAHDAFGYFGAAYDVEVIGLQGLSTSTEAGLRDVARLVDVIVERKIKAVFVESSVPPRTIEAVIKGCEQKGWRVRMGGTLYSDALGPEGSEAESYIGMMRHNVRTLVAALK